MTEQRFIEPLDVIYLRGNRSFGEPGSYGESLLPPWPSVGAGALRSLIYAETGKVLEAPEDFRLTAFGLARRAGDRIESLHAMPADLIVSGERKSPSISRLKPAPLAEGILSSASLRQVPVLCSDERSKPLSGFWLKQSGWQRYLDGQLPQADELVTSDVLWKTDERVGVGLDEQRRSAADGKLFSMQAIAFAAGVGFITASSGNHPLPQQGTLRLGGDGRGAALHACNSRPSAHADHAAIAKAGCARLVLTSPGIFADGWRLPGMQVDGAFELAGIRGRVVAAALARGDVISGWDLKKRQPKPAQRVVPSGAVYWLEDLKGDATALDKLVDRGLWPESMQDSARRVEGFNRFAFAAI